MFAPIPNQAVDNWFAFFFACGSVKVHRKVGNLSRLKDYIFKRLYFMSELIYDPTEDRENVNNNEKIEFSNDPEPTPKDVDEAGVILEAALKNPESGAGGRLEELLDGNVKLTNELLNWAGAHKTELVA